MKNDMLKKILQLTLKDKYKGIWIDHINQKIYIGQEFDNIRANFTGEHKQWWENGKLWNHCFYENGKIHGEYKSWHKNRQLWEHYFYEKGLFHGEYKVWDEYGQLNIHDLYKHGKLVKDFLNKNDMLNNILQITSEDKEEGIFIDKKNQKIYLRPNQLPKDFTGKYKAWWSNGKLSVRKFYKNGNLHGEDQEWFSDGQLQKHFTYENNLVTILKKYKK